jgi:hypothetical protein
MLQMQRIVPHKFPTCLMKFVELPVAMNVSYTILYLSVPSYLVYLAVMVDVGDPFTQRKNMVKTQCAQPLG